MCIRDRQRACGALDWMADKKRALVTRAFATHELACEDADRTDELLVRLWPPCSQCDIACGVRTAACGCGGGYNTAWHQGGCCAIRMILDVSRSGADCPLGGLPLLLPCRLYLVGRVWACLVCGWGAWATLHSALAHSRVPREQAALNLSLSGGTHKTNYRVTSTALVCGI